MPMRPYKTKLDGKDTSLACIHWRTFPPLDAFSGEDAEALRQAGVIDQGTYQRHLIWKRVCGLLQMDDGKCRTCPHIRRVDTHPVHPPALVTLDGRVRVPILDKAFLTALPRHRSSLMVTQRRDGTRHAKRDAAWVAKVKEESSDG